MLTVYIALVLIGAQIALGSWFITYLLNHDRGSKEPRKIILLAGLLGMLAVIVAIPLELVLVRDINTLSNHHLPAAALLRQCLYIGAIEELAKAGLLMAFIYKKGYFNELTDGLIYFGIAGMVFGVIEDVGYTLSMGIGAGIGKLVFGPFVHAGFTIIIGWAVARRKVLGGSSLNILLAILAAIGLHGLYDFGVFTGGFGLLLAFIITLFVNINIFWLYKRAQRGDEKLGLSAVGINNFCRHCGAANPKGYLYCTSCGQKA